MRNRKIDSKRFLGVILIMSFLTSLFGCAAQKTPQYTAAEDFPPAYEKPVPELPGKLVGVIHESSAGSMEFASEFAIDVVPGEIRHCEYWDLNVKRDEMIRKNNVPITEAQWTDVEKAVLDMWGSWEEIPEEVLNQPDKPDDSEIFVLDGGDYNRWWLSWETADGTKKVRYYAPADRRILTLDAVLEELVHPTGRKIEWQEPPALSGATYINDTTDMSFQCNWWNLPEGPKEGYRFIVRFKEGSEKVDIYDKTDDAVWNAAKPAFAWLNPDDFEHGSYQDKIMLSLYYSDGTQDSLKLDKKTAAAIEPYLRQLTLEYLEQK